VQIRQEDYEYKDPNYLKEPLSFIDASKPELLDETVVARKIDDPQNRFKYVGRLLPAKFSELIGLLNKAGGDRYLAPGRQRSIAFAQKCIIQETLERLNKLAK